MIFSFGSRNFVLANIPNHNPLAANSIGDQRGILTPSQSGGAVQASVGTDDLQTVTQVSFDGV